MDFSKLSEEFEHLKDGLGGEKTAEGSANPLDEIKEEVGAFILKTADEKIEGFFHIEHHTPAAEAAPEHKEEAEPVKTEEADDSDKDA